MRAGPFSDSRVISLLNSSFVPVYVSNEDYRGAGGASPDERAEYQRVFTEFGQKIGDFTKERCSTGTVHVYIMRPDGRAIDSLHVAVAARKDRLLEMLQAVSGELHTIAGPPVVHPSHQSAAPASKPGDLVVHLTARGDGTGPAGGSWREFPSENWLVLSRTEWSGLLPPSKAGPGVHWTFDPAVTARILRYFYPQSEEGDSADVLRNRLDAASLTAEVVTFRGPVGLALVSGSLRMKHNFYPGRDDNNFVTAAVKGYLDFDPRSRTIRTLRLVSDHATYGKSGFTVAVRSTTAPYFASRR